MKLLFTLFFLFPLFAQAQEEWHPRPKKTTTITEADLHPGNWLDSDDFEHGYQPTSAPGWIIKTGDTLHLGKGTMPNRSFAFIYQETGRHYLSNLYAGKPLVIKELTVIGRKKLGFTAVAIVRAGVRCYVQLENAIQAGEILPPAQFRKEMPVSSSTASVADELLKYKQLLDSGAITQQEYDAQKKKLLNQ